MDIKFVQSSFLEKLMKLFCCGNLMKRSNASKARLCQGSCNISELVESAGFSSKFCIRCRNNPANHVMVLSSSGRLDSESNSPQPHLINLSIILNMMLNGLKFTNINDFCTGIGAGSIGYPAYKSIRDRVQSAMEILAESSRREALREIISNAGKEIRVAIDGTWSKRYGHNANFGAVIAIHTQSRKIIGTSVFSRICHICSRKDNEFPACSGCQKNWERSAGAMEPAGYAQIAHKLLMQDDARITSVLADGDSKGFDLLKSVMEGIYTPIKLNDKSHYGKRFAPLIATVKLKLGNKLLSDGKPISGQGRLTVDAAKEIGVLVSSNLVRRVKPESTREEIKKWIWCVWKHKSSTDKHPQHEDCNASFCRYLKAQEKGKIYLHNPKRIIPRACMDALMTVFEDLTSNILLDSLRHNDNTDLVEAFNSMIWSVDSKSQMSSLGNVSFAVNLASCYFNDGHETTLRNLFGLLGAHLPEARIERAREDDASRARQFAERKEAEVKKQTIGLAAADLEFDKQQLTLQQQLLTTPPKMSRKRTFLSSESLPVRSSKRKKSADYGAGICANNV